VPAPASATAPTASEAETLQELAWVRRVQQDGDRDAFGHLVRRHQASVRALLRRLCRGDSARADELAQDCFLQAWQALPGFRAHARLRTWLFRIAYTEFLQDQRRGASQLQAHSQPWADADDTGEATPATGAASHAFSADPTPALDWRMDVQQALNALPPAEREAIACCDLGDLSHAEAAEVLGRPLGSVKTQVLRGRARLRLALAAWAPAP
jgi:RNA polymerase sigma-70 factor (ECF subfamily)